MTDIREIAPVGEPCQDCEGTGRGCCNNCGDGYTECACDENNDDFDDCDSCDGTGVVQPTEEER